MLPIDTIDDDPNFYKTQETTTKNDWNAKFCAKIHLISLIKLKIVLTDDRNSK